MRNSVEIHRSIPWIELMSTRQIIYFFCNGSSLHSLERISPAVFIMFCMAPHFWPLANLMEVEFFHIWICRDWTVAQINIYSRFPSREENLWLLSVYRDAFRVILSWNGASALWVWPNLKLTKLRKDSITDTEFKPAASPPSTFRFPPTLMLDFLFVQSPSLVSPEQHWLPFCWVGLTPALAEHCDKQELKSQDQYSSFEFWT